MNRLTHATRATDLFGVGKHGYTGGTPGVTPPTVLDSAAMNPLQEELARAVEAFTTLNAGDLGQLATILLGITRNVVLTSSETPVFSANDAPSAHPGSPSNRWKLLLEAPCSDSTKIRLFSGDGTNGNLAITSNASWDADVGQVWSKDQTGQASNLFRLKDSSIEMYGRAAGAGTWADGSWTVTGTLHINHLNAQTASFGDDVVIGGDLGVTGTATAASFTATGTVQGNDLVATDDLTVGDDAHIVGDATIDGTVNVGGDLNVDDDLVVDEDVNVGGSLVATGDVTGEDVWSVDDVHAGSSVIVGSGTYAFSPDRVRTDELNLYNGWAPNWDFATGYALGQDYFHPINLPVGSILHWVEVMFGQSTATPSVLRAKKRSATAWGSAPPGITTLDTETGPSSVGNYQLLVEFGDVTISGSDRYFIQLTNNDPLDPIYAIRVHWTQDRVDFAG